MNKSFSKQLVLDAWFIYTELGEFLKSIYIFPLSTDPPSVVITAPLI